MGKLSNLTHEAFALAYVGCLGNGAAAARRVKDFEDSNDARYFARDLLLREDVLDRIDELAAERIKVLQIEADEVLNEMHRIALADIALAFDPVTNDLLPIHDMPLDIRKGVSGVKIDALFEGSGKDKVQVGYTKEVKFWNKERGLEMLARVLALFKDSLHVKTQDGHDLDENSRAARAASLFELARKRRETGDDLV
jgi:phage terminase small subunit